MPCPLFFRENKLSQMGKYAQPKNIWETGQSLFIYIPKYITSNYN